MSMLSKISTNYVCFAMVALVVGGFVLNSVRPHVPMLSGNAGQIAFGITYMVSGFIILTLTYVVFRRMCS